MLGRGQEILAAYLTSFHFIPGHVRCVHYLILGSQRRSAGVESRILLQEAGPAITRDVLRPPTQTRVKICAGRLSNVYTAMMLHHVQNGAIQGLVIPHARSNVPRG